MEGEKISLEWLENEGWANWQKEEEKWASERRGDWYFVQR